MTQFTSFVAVEEMTITDGGQPRRVDVPIEMPEGVNMQIDGVDNMTGLQSAQKSLTGARFSSAMRASRPAAPGGGFQVGSVAETVTVTSAESAPINTTSSSISTTVHPPPAAPAPGDRQSRLTKEEEKRFANNRADSAPPAAPTAEEVRRQQIVAKLHPSLAAVVVRLWKNDAKPGADEAKFVREGKAEVQVWLTDKTDATMAQLKALGFEIILDPKSGKVVIGRLPLEKLAALAELKEVIYVAPQTAGGK